MEKQPPKRGNLVRPALCHAGVAAAALGVPLARAAPAPGAVAVFPGVDGGDGAVVILVGVFVLVFFGGFADCCFGAGSEVVVGGGQVEGGTAEGAAGEFDGGVFIGGGAGEGGGEGEEVDEGEGEPHFGGWWGGEGGR